MARDHWFRHFQLGALFLCSCGSSVEYPPAVGKSSIVVSGHVTSHGKPLPGVAMAIEIGGHYVTNPDTSKGNPAYQRGTVTDAQGAFSIKLAPGSFGFHSFFGGYRYGTQGLAATDDTTLELPMEINDSEPQPKLTNAQLTPDHVGASGAFTVSVTAAAASSKDPLSEEVIVVEPTTSTSAALDPPSAGVQGNGFPDGEWKRALTAPAAPGAYTYYLSATSEGCIVSDLTKLTLVVQ